MPTSLESLHDIKLKALRIKPYLEERDEKSKETYGDLVDRFYQENEVMVAPQQCAAAKNDFEYFLRLIDLALAYFADGMETSGQIQ